MVGSIERYLKKESYGFSVSNSIEFAGTRELLKVKQKALKSAEKGNKPNASRSLTDSEVDSLNFSYSLHFTSTQPDEEEDIQVHLHEEDVDFD